MTTKVDFGDATKWEQVYSISLTTDQGNGIKAPIQELELPYLFQNNIINIVTNSQSANANWKTAGYVSKFIRTGITLNGNAINTIQTSKRLSLNVGNLIIYPDFTEEYTIKIRTVHWLQDITYIAYIYTGTVFVPTDDIISQIFTVQLPRIESKIDGIADT